MAEPAQDADGGRRPSGAAAQGTTAPDGVPGPEPFLFIERVDPGAAGDALQRCRRVAFVPRGGSGGGWRRAAVLRFAHSALPCCPDRADLSQVPPPPVCRAVNDWTAAMGLATTGARVTGALSGASPAVPSRLREAPSGWDPVAPAAGRLRSRDRRR